MWYCQQLDIIDKKIASKAQIKIKFGKMSVGCSICKNCFQLNWILSEYSVVLNEGFDLISTSEDYWRYNC